MTDATAKAPMARQRRGWSIADIVREYGVLLIIVLLLVVLTLLSDSFLTPRNLLNILNQSTPLFIVSCALTLVIIGGGFDLSTGAIFGVAAVSAAWIALNVSQRRRSVNSVCVASVPGRNSLIQMPSHVPNQPVNRRSAVFTTLITSASHRRNSSSRLRATNARRFQIAVTSSLCDRLTCGSHLVTCGLSFT